MRDKLTYEEYKEIVMGDLDKRLAFYTTSNISLIISLLITNGLITKEEYDKQQKEIMDNLVKQGYDSLTDEQKATLFVLNLIKH